MQRRQFKYFFICLLLFFLYKCVGTNKTQKNLNQIPTQITENKTSSDLPNKIKDSSGQHKVNPKAKDEVDQQPLIATVNLPAPPEQLKTPETEITFPFFIENERNPDITTLLGENKLFDFEVLHEQLARWVFPETLKKLDSKVINKNDKKWISIDGINSIGINANFNEMNQDLKLFIPATLKLDQEVNLGVQNTMKIPEGSVKPNDFSSYLNVNAKQPFGYSNLSIDEQNGRQNFFSELESVTNIHSFVFDLNAEYQEKSSFKRDDFRAIKDDPDNMLRYIAGDLLPASGGFLQGRQMGGVSVTREFSLQPSKTITPINSYKVFIKRPSSVKIFVNGILSQTIYLPSGTFDLRNLPVTIGLNNVSLEVIDDLGQKEILEVPSFNFSQQNLKQGLSQFNYSVGAPSTDTLTNRTYDKSRATYSLYHRYGLTNNLTLGAYSQGDHFQNISGMGATVSTALGVFSLEEAYSRIFENQDYYGLGSRFNYTYTNREIQNTFSLNVEHKTLNFAQLGNLNPSNTDLLNLDASYYQPFGQTGLTLSNTYGINTVGSNPWSASVGVSRNFTNNFNMGGAVTYGKDSNSIANTAFTINLNWIISAAQSLSANYAPKTDEYNVQHRYSQNVNQTDRVDTFLVNSNSQGTNSVNGDLRYYGRHGYLGIQEYEQSRDSYVGSGKQVSSVTSLVGGFSLAYAGGTFGISQPISDSFVIFKPDEKLNGQPLVVNPTNDKEKPFAAKSDWLSNAIVPVSGYSPTTLQIGTPKLVEGLSLEKVSFDIIPTYKSGTALDVKVASFISIKGSIVDSKNKPIALYDGNIRSETGELNIPIYTTEDGIFFIEGLQPGIYTVSLKDDELSTFTFFIKPESYGVIDLGVVTATSTR
jgi:outer membrane usher protein